jgi:5'-AMP-activated protein kinase catalytic alpha subunit
VDPQLRYTIDEIRRHPWMTYGAHKRNSKGIIVGYNQIPIDSKILNSLTQYEVDVEKTKICLEANRHNNLTTTYYLEFKKFLKDGGQSSCDFGSKDFDKSLL